METQKEEFSYTYSSKEQEELKRIRKKYEAGEEDKMSLLRRMDAKVSRKASVVSLSVGIIGVLIMGSGMSLIMSDLYKLFGMHGAMAMTIGIVLGAIGITIACFAYPVYNRVLRKERERIAPDIIRLTDELMK